MSYAFWYPFPSPYDLSKLNLYLSRSRKYPKGKGIFELIFFQFGPRHFLLSLHIFYTFGKIFFTFYPGSVVIFICGYFRSWSEFIGIAQSAIVILQVFSPQMINYLVNNICWKIYPFHIGFKCHIYYLLNKYIGLLRILFSIPFISHYSQWRTPQEAFLSWLHSWPSLTNRLDFQVIGKYLPHTLA